MPFVAPNRRPIQHQNALQQNHCASSPPGSSSSTVPIAELVADASKASVDRCVYFNPPSAGRESGGEDKDKSGGAAEEHQQQKGLRRFFFGDSPQLARHFPPQQPFPLPQFNPPGVGVNVQNSPSLSTLRAGRPMLSRKKTFGGVSLSSRTISVDFDSETSGTTDDADRMEFVHQKCNGKADHLTINNAHRSEQKHQNHPPMESPIIAARQQLHPCQQTQFNGAQFDTQSLRSRSRSISHPNNTLPPNAASHQQHHQHRQHSSSGGFRYGSCTNLSALNGSGGGAGPLVLYDGGVGTDAECPPTAPQRHSMALIEAQMPSPYWYHQPQPMLHPPPPPFYYTAATLPHPPPPPPMDLATFRRALKESERMEKERKVLVGERGLCAACWEFCCGGSALILWLVITLIALGFLGFLLLAIYFL